MSHEIDFLAVQQVFKRFVSQPDPLVLSPLILICPQICREELCTGTIMQKNAWPNGENHTIEMYSEQDYVKTELPMAPCNAIRLIGAQHLDYGERAIVI